MTAVATRLANMASFRVLAGMVLVLGVLGAQAGSGTLAVFTSTATSTSNSFSAGSVVIKLTDANETSLSSVSASIGGTIKSPGDTFLAGFIDVLNTGSLELRYAVATTDTTTASTENTALDNALTVGVATRTVASGACPSTLAGTGNTTIVSAGTALKTLAIGDPATGAQTGDRTLAASTGSERLCFYVTVGSSLTDQGGSASYTFTFSAEQTANT